MEKISINLLPLELRTKSKAEISHSLVVKLSVGVLVFSIIISALALSWSVIQSQQLKKTGQEYQSIISKIKANEKKEGLITLLKNRLALISQISEKESEQTSAFNLVNSLIPQNVQALNLKIDKSGSVEINCFSNNLQDVKILIDNLTDSSQTEGKITSAKIVNFTKNSSGYIFEIELSFNSKGKTPAATNIPLPNKNDG